MACFVGHGLPYLFGIKHEMSAFFFMEGDLLGSNEPCLFYLYNLCEVRIEFLICAKSVFIATYSVLTRIFYFGVHRTHREAKRGSCRSQFRYS